MLRYVGVLIAAAIVAGTASAAPAGEDQRLRVREFRVPAGTHPHDVAPARDGGIWYTAQHTGQLGWLDPDTGRSRLTGAGPGFRAARRDRRAGRSALDHRRRAERDRAGRPAYEKGPSLRAPQEQRLHESEHRDLRPQRCPVVHGAERDLRTPRSAGREGARFPRAPRRRAVRDHDDAFRRRLLRIPRGVLSRSHRSAHRASYRPPPTDGRSGRAPRLVGLPRSHLDQRVERGKGRHVRPGCETLARVARSRRESDDLRRLRGRVRQRLAHGLRRERPLALRSGGRSGSRASCSRAPMPRCASCSGVAARFGAPSREPTSSSSSRRAERRRAARGRPFDRSVVGELSRECSASQSMSSSADRSGSHRSAASTCMLMPNDVTATIVRTAPRRSGRPSRRSTSRPSDSTVVARAAWPKSRRGCRGAVDVRRASIGARTARRPHLGYGLRAGLASKAVADRRVERLLLRPCEIERCRARRPSGIAVLRHREGSSRITTPRSNRKNAFGVVSSDATSPPRATACSDSNHSTRSS